MTASPLAASAPEREIDRTNGPELSAAEIRRYARHLIMPEVGIRGQRKLRAARVLCVGTGGLGSPLALYLAAAGVGTLGLVDFDVVDESNLQRQLLHGTKDVGRPKLHSARDRIADVNPHVEVVLHEARLTSDNALDILAGYDIIADGTDNFPTRYLVNDACVLLGKPNVYASIFRFEGQVAVFDATQGPCYRCLFPEPPPPGLVPNCADGGVLGVLPGVVGSLQALEAIKLIVGAGEPLVGRMMLFDALAMSWHTIKVKKRPECPVCGVEPTVTALVDYEQFCGIGSEPDGPMVATMEPVDFVARRSAGELLTLIDVRESHEWEIVNLEEQGAMLIPLSALPDRIGELDPDEEIVVHCKSGARSAKAVAQLLAAGFPRVWNLQGGIMAWSDQVDSSKVKY